MSLSYQYVLCICFYRRSCPSVIATHQSSLKIYLLHLSDYVSEMVHEVLNGVELELVYNFLISCSIVEIWTKVQHADVDSENVKDLEAAIRLERTHIPNMIVCTPFKGGKG